jgi:type IX secretion system substrate protein
MKKFKLFLLLSAMLAAYTSFAQYADFQSIAYPPAFLQPGPNGEKSMLVTLNGFDNIFLGTDFGEPYIATNPRNPLNSMCAFNINVAYYTIDGFNWFRNTPTFPGFSVIGDPVMAYDSVGTLYYVQLYQNGSTYGICTRKSSDGGQTYGNTYNIWATTAGLADKEWVTCDQSNGPYTNNVYVCWRQFGSSGMRFTRSTDGGASWSSPTSFGGDQGAYCSVGPNGNVPGGSVYMANLSGSSIVVARSTDGGATFGPQLVATNYAAPGTICAGRNTVKNCIRMDAFPRMAADNSYTSTRGNVYIAYCSNPTGPDGCDIFVVRSTDYGSTWSSAVRVNDDATITDQWMPTIAVDKVTGKVFVSWYDSREDAGNLQTKLYSATSTNGGVSFTTNANVSEPQFNPNNMAQGQPGGHNYIGDYIGVSAIGNTGYSVWMDGRNNNLGSYVAYYPDYAMTVNPSEKSVLNNDSTTFTVVAPAKRGPFGETIKYTVSLDSIPTSGTIQLSFVNGKDTINNIPDSVFIRVRTVGTVTPRLYTLKITGKGKVSQAPVHIRTVGLLVNSSRLTVGTNRPTICDFQVNGVTYNTTQSLIFTNGSTVNVRAISPRISGFYRYVYLNWSDNGDTAHNVILNNSLVLTAFYKAQYKIQINSVPGNTYGGNDFFDSASSRTFGVLSRDIFFNGSWYQFKGWTGSGNGSYTSPDTSGNDVSATVTLLNPIVEIANWRTPPIGIKTISAEIPKEFRVYQNYPNPFNPKTLINFDLPKKEDVKIAIYDLLGREVEVLTNNSMEPGKYSLDFDAANYASGVYFYRITAGEFSDIKKMLIVK